MPTTEPTILPDEPTMLETEPTTPATEQTAPTRKDVQLVQSHSVPVVYQKVQDDYANIVAWRLSDNFEYEYNSGVRITLSSSLQKLSQEETDLGYHWHCMLVEMPQGTDFLTEDDFGYRLIDLNGDGADELLWTRTDGAVLAIFAAYNGEAHLLDAFWSRYSCRVTEEGKLLVVGSGGTVYTNYEIKSLDASGKELVTEQMFGVDGWDTDANTASYFEVIDGQKVPITEEYLKALQEEFFATPQ